VVATPGDQVPYALVGPDGEPVEPVQDYLAELLAADCSPLTLRSYAFDLLDWFRFLAAAGVGWQHATRALVRDWVLGLRGRPDPRRGRRGRNRAPSGASSTATGKPPQDRSAPGHDPGRDRAARGPQRHHPLDWTQVDRDMAEPVVTQWVQTQLADRPDLLGKLSG
jgi:hypothetical protein